jgi:hypothetical protein
MSILMSRHFLKQYRFHKGKVKSEEFGKKWFRLSQDLVKKWRHEFIMSV